MLFAMYPVTASVYFSVSVVIVGGCLFEAVLQSIGAPLWPHMHLLLCWSDGSLGVFASLSMMVM